MFTSGAKSDKFRNKYTSALLHEAHWLVRVLLNFFTMHPKTALSHPDTVFLDAVLGIQARRTFIPHAAGVLMAAIWQTPGKLSCDIYPGGGSGPATRYHEGMMDGALRRGQSLPRRSSAAISVVAPLVGLWKQRRVGTHKGDKNVPANCTHDNV